MYVGITEAKKLKIYNKKRRNIVLRGIFSFNVCSNFFFFNCTKLKLVGTKKDLNSIISDQSFEIKVNISIKKERKNKTNIVTLKLTKHESNKTSNKISF